MSPEPVVVCDPPRADQDATRRLGEAGVATVCEAAGRRGLLDPSLRPIYEGCFVAGTAVTALCQPGDNLMIHVAVEQCRPGDVLVVAVTSPSTDGMFGELLATSVRAQGALGLVTDTGVRDVADLRDMAFPVWSRAVSAQGTVKATLGAVNTDVVCGGTLVRAGDVIVGDGDGVVCVPRERAAEVAERSEERVRREHQVRARLAAGELGLDIYSLRAFLEEQGLAYVDAAERPDAGHS